MLDSNHRAHRLNAPPPPNFKSPTSLPNKNANNRNALTNQLYQMQQRFQDAASNIQEILNARNFKKGAGRWKGSSANAEDDSSDEDSSRPINTTTQIASQLMIWKDDVAELLEMVQQHIVRCQKIEEHETRSHKPKETQLDFRRKRINEFLLFLFLFV